LAYFFGLLKLLMLITREYAQLNKDLHESHSEYGTSGQRWADRVLFLKNKVSAASILDYGCGKQTLAAALPALNITGYDPALPGLDAPAAPAELVVCTDVLEHVEPDCVEDVLDDLCRVTLRIALVTVATRPAVKVLADGRNAHLTVRPLAWWRDKFESRFDIIEVQEFSGFEFSLVLKAVHTDIDWQEPATPSVNRKATESRSEKPILMRVKHNNYSMVFHTPNEMTRWRVESLHKKEPHTIQWLEQIPQDAILVDVGANVGMYTVFAAVTRKARVYAFEPESQNYALLNQNIIANNLSGKVLAYPIALSNERIAAPLYLSSFSAGGSCHSFGEEIGFDLMPRGSFYEQGSFAVTLDQLVISGAMPCPNYIKIDVDGIEHKVIEGAINTLKNPEVREILIELNTNLSQHTEIIKKLQQLGFLHDAEQASSALRKDGAFEGVGEFIFRRHKTLTVSDMGQQFSIRPPKTSEGWKVLQHVVDRISRTEVHIDPFPHLVVDEVFPNDYYELILSRFPESTRMRPLSDSGRVAHGQYEERYALLFLNEEFARLTKEQAEFWRSLSEWLYSDPLANAFITRFHECLQPRMNVILNTEGQIRAKGDALLVQDHTRYAIGPHTDAPHRLVTFLFYLPRDNSMREFGTSLYKPKDPNFTCWGGPHHSFEQFERIKTVEFLPNRLLVFPKTEKSFHGVEQIQKNGIERRLLINNVRLLNSTTH
jgi:FkbM family methyltransferase